MEGVASDGKGGVGARLAPTAGASCCTLDALLSSPAHSASSRMSLSLAFLIWEVGTMEDRRVALPGSAEAACQRPECYPSLGSSGSSTKNGFLEASTCFLSWRLLSMLQHRARRGPLCSPPLVGPSPELGGLDLEYGG